MDAIGVASGRWSREGETVAVMTGAQLVSIDRDTDTWLVVRDTARDRFDRIRRG